MNKISNTSNFSFSSYLISLLQDQGLSFFSVCSGSRNTPLSLAIAENPSVEKRIFFDERSAGFYALGYALGKKKPSAVVTTSGSAVANLFPSVVEAFESKVPLLLITADRPQSLRNTHANQTIDQEKFFGSYTCFYASIAVHKEESPQFLQQLTYKLFSFMKGPCHINLCFDEPLFTEETFTGKPIKPIKTHFCYFDSLEKIEPPSYKKGLILIGKGENKDLNPIFTLAKKLQWPVISDILSQEKTVKKDPLSISHSSCFLSPLYIPEAVLHFGERFVSKKLFTLLQTKPPSYYAHIDSSTSVYNPYSLVTERFFCSPSSFCKAFSIPERKETTWLVKWQEADLFWEKKLSEERGFTEPLILQNLSEYLPKDCSLFLGNSLSIRHADQRLKNTPYLSCIYANRGCSGIDGNIATCFGISQGEKKKLIAILGDVTCLHDLNSFLLFQEHSFPVVFVIINNQGGAIFDMLPVKKSKHLNSYFKTSHNWNFSDFAKAFKVPYFSISTEKELTSLSSILENQEKGIVELFTSKKSLSQEIFTPYVQKATELSR